MDVDGQVPGCLGLPCIGIGGVGGRCFEKVNFLNIVVFLHSLRVIIEICKLHEIGILDYIFFFLHYHLSFTHE